MAEERARPSVISRVTRIIDTFDHGRRELSLAAVAARTGLPMTTAHRLMTEMEREGLLRRDEDGRWCVGMRLWELVARSSPVGALDEVATPFMRDLLGAVGEHVALAVIDRGSVLYIVRLSSPTSQLDQARIAERMPLHASSSGLVLLANSAPEFQEQILSGPLEQTTPSTCTDPVKLRRMLADVRRAGYAAPASVGRVGWLGIAVPVRQGRSVVAALNVMLPEQGADKGTILPALRTVAAGISRVLSEQDGPVR